MSSGKRFEKTFSRKKKETNNKNVKTNDEEEHVLISQLKSSSSSPKNKKKTGPTIAQKETNNHNKKKKEKEGSGLKQKVQNDGKDQTLKHKRKAESGDVKKEKNPNTVVKAKKPRKEEEKEESSECVFPMNRIMRIVKSEGTSDFKISGEAVFLINKAAEKFIELFSKDAYNSAVEERKSFVGYKHLASAVCKEKRLDFLSDFVPEKVAAEKALAERKPAETLVG